MASIQSQIQVLNLPTNSNVIDKIGYVFEVLYKALNIAYMRGIFDFPTATDIQKHALQFHSISKNLRDGNYDNVSSVQDIYNFLANLTETARVKGSFNIPDGDLINQTCFVFKSNLLPQLNKIATQSKPPSNKESPKSVTFSDAPITQTQENNLD
jgi:hypothetical protein